MCVTISHVTMGQLIPKSENMFLTTPAPTTGAYSGIPRMAVRPRRDTDYHIEKAKHGEAKAEAAWNLRQAYFRVDQEKAAKSIKVIDYIQPVEQKREARSKSIHVCRCKATTLTGRQCPFKASHGDFCKKHK